MIHQADLLGTCPICTMGHMQHDIGSASAPTVTYHGCLDCWSMHTSHLRISKRTTSLQIIIGQPVGVFF